MIATQVWIQLIGSSCWSNSVLNLASIQSSAEGNLSRNFFLLVKGCSVIEKYRFEKRVFEILLAGFEHKNWYFYFIFTPSNALYITWWTLSTTKRKELSIKIVQMLHEIKPHMEPRKKTRYRFFCFKNCKSFQNIL